MEKNNKQFDIKIPKEQFEFANQHEKISDKKFDTKPIGYFKDAFIRFSKNKASVVASIIIILIVVYALVIPLFSTKQKGTLMDTIYRRKGPRIELLYDLGVYGATTKELNERAFIAELAKGVGAASVGDDIVSIKESMDNYYQPVKKITAVKEEQQGSRVNTVYTSKVDSYLSVGFIIKTVEQSEYQRLLAWQEETGLQVLYPLIESNEYWFGSDSSDSGNYWYKALKNGTPVSVSENGTVTELKYSEDLVLQDNFRRDSEGNLVYWAYAGGGNNETAMYQVRILYYTYYQFQNGYEPYYLLGTDSQGYDLSIRMANGIKLSLLLAVCVSVINFVIGAIYGAVEGYYGGALDLALERVSDILSGIPFIVVATLFQLHLAKEVGPIPSLIFAFVLTGWIGTASRVRSQFYRFKNQEYVMAARTLGARDRRIIWKHIFPNTLGTIITSSVLVIPSVIFSESMLSYLGIVKLGGSQTTSLGTLLSDASSIWTMSPHLILYPSIIISLLMICFNLFGNGLRDAFNPTLRGVEE